ncbi:hypothetical protein D3C74_329660 [compost metagenome]
MVFGLKNEPAPSTIPATLMILDKWSGDKGSSGVKAPRIASVIPNVAKLIASLPELP